MENKSQCAGGLLYHSYTVAYMNVFSTSRLCGYSAKLAKPSNAGLCLKEVVSDEIDRQLFTHDKTFVDRFHLHGFRIHIDVMDGNGVSVEGEIKVRAAFFFQNTALLSFRLIVPSKKIEFDFTEEFCGMDRDFINSDQLITIAALIQGVEMWSYDEESKQQKIDGIMRNVHISGFPLDYHGNYSEGTTYEFTSLEEAFNRYRAFFDDTYRAVRPHGGFVYDSLNYTMIDIWEDFSHAGKKYDFSKMDDPAVIAHVEEHHRAELVGIMSYYPEEWPFRMEQSFGDICGRNIAIDTDDIVLANNNVCIVFGTYGNRDGWKEHLLQRCHYHVSWPEYLYLLELVLIRKHTLNYALNRYCSNSQEALQHGKQRDFIENNAELSIELTNMVSELDSIRYLRYVSHKHMYKVTLEELGVLDDEKEFRGTVKIIDDSLNNYNNMIELKESGLTTKILWVISVASLFGVLLQSDDVPIVTYFFERGHGIFIGSILLAITAAIIIFSLLIAATTSTKFIRLKIRRYRDDKKRCK